MNEQQAKQLKRAVRYARHKHKVLVLVNDEREIDEVRRVVESVPAQRLHEDYDTFIGCSVPSAVYATTDEAVARGCVTDGEYNFFGGIGSGEVITRCLG